MHAEFWVGHLPVVSHMMSLSFPEFVVACGSSVEPRIVTLSDWLFGKFVGVCIVICD